MQDCPLDAAYALPPFDDLSADLMAACRLRPTARLLEEHDHDHPSAGGVGLAQVALASAVLFGTTAAAAAVPFMFRWGGGLERLFPFTNALAGGALLGFAFFHLLPETFEIFEKLDMKLKLPGGEISWGLVIAAAAFLFIFCIDLVADSHPAPPHEPVEVERPLTGSRPSSARSKPHDHCDVSSSLAAVFLSIHAFLEGLVVGVAESTSLLWIATGSILLHKSAAAFSLASAMLLKKMTLRASLVFLIIFAAASPVAAMIGLLIDSSGGPAVGVVNAVCLGSLLYVGLHMTFEAARCPLTRMQRVLQSALLVAGTALVFGAVALHYATAGAHVH